MSVFKRLSTSLVARVDQMVSQIENHDAVIEAAIRNARQAAARAKVRLARVRNDGGRLRRKIAALQSEEVKWTERARASAGTDEETALECLRRRRQCQAQTAQLTEALERHEEMEQRLERDVRSAEERIGEMSQQRNLMRTRQAAAEALTSVSGVDEAAAGDIAETLERWEIQVTEAEIEAGAAEMGDALERDFVEAEDREALRAELQALMSQEDRRHED